MILGQAAPLGPFEEQFVRLVDAPAAGPVVVATSLAVAFGVGALHALAPGHGKAIAAAYLAGSRGRPRDALALGVVVALMHTASVLVLGTGLLAVMRSGDAAGIGQRVAPALRIAAGLLVTAVGTGLLVARVRQRGQAQGRSHGHDHPLPDTVPPLSRRGLFVIGASGGLLPSPSAFLVVATAAFTGRLAFGLLLVAAFSAGLAATLTAIGLAVVAGRGRLLSTLGAGVGRRAAAALPWIAAVAITLGGIVLTLRGSADLLRRAL